MKFLYRDHIDAVDFKRDHSSFLNSWQVFKLERGGLAHCLGAVELWMPVKLGTMRFQTAKGHRSGCNEPMPQQIFSRSKNILDASAKTSS